MLESVLASRPKFVEKVTKMALWAVFLTAFTYTLLLPFITKQAMLTFVMGSCTLFYALGIILYRKYPQAIKVLFIVVYDMGLMMVATLVGSTVEIVVVYFINIVLILVIFDNQDGLTRFFLVLITLLCVVLLETSHYTLFGLVEKTDFGAHKESVLYYSRYVCIVASYGIVIAILYFSNNNLIKTEEHLHQMVAELIKTRASLEVQNDLKNALDNLQASEEELKQNLEELQATQDILVLQEQKFRHLFEGSNDAIMMLSGQGNVDCNNATLKLFNISKENFVITHPRFLSPTYQPNGRLSEDYSNEKIAEAFQHGFAKFEWVHQKYTGEYFDAEVLLSPFQSTEGTLMQATVRDITARKKAEQALKANTEALLVSEEELKQNLEELQATQEILVLQEQKFRHLFEGSNDAIMTLNATGFLDCNQATLKQFEISEEDFINTHPGLLSPEFQPNGKLSKDYADEKIAEAMQNGYARFEWMHKKYTGECFEAEVLLSPYESASGLIIQATVRDITARKNIEQQIRRLSMVAEKVSNGVVITDQKQRITWVNGGFERMTGYTLDELKGKNPNVLQGKDTNPAHKQCIRQKLSEKKPFTQIILNYHKNGIPYWCEITITPIFGEAGEIEQFIGIEQDVTLREQAQAELEYLSQKVQAQNQELQNSLAQVLELRQKSEKARAESEKARIESELLLDKITQSINYAQRIQDAIIPKETELQKCLDCFVFFRPRDIVSGDFYWFANKENKKILVVADCTGHGVPGAFMTIIGNNLLNQIIHDKEIHSPDQILHHLQISLRQTLAGDSRSIKDGMDIAIIAVTPLQEVENMNQVKIEYAGAINPLHYTNPDSELQVIKANKIFIGDEIRDTDKFTNHTLFAQKGQVFYLCSDGYQDQFGGKDDKKFRIQTLRGLLTEISPKQMQEQKEILGNTFDAWKGEKEQTDDVLVVGVKI